MGMNMSVVVSIVVICTVSFVVLFVTKAATKIEMKYKALGFLVALLGCVAATQFMTLLIRIFTGRIISVENRFYPSVTIVSAVLFAWTTISVIRMRREKNPQSFGKRCLHFLPAFFSLVFTLFIFGPIDIYLNNIEEFTPNLVTLEIIPLLLLFGVLSSVVLSCWFACLFYRKSFSWALFCTVAVSLCFYLQGTYLNKNLTTIDGRTDAVPRSAVLLNLVVWLLIVAGILLFTKKITILRETIWYLVPLWIVLVQLIAGVYAVISTPKTTDVSAIPEHMAFSTDEMLTVSEEENIIVIILDYFSNQYVPIILERYPDALDCLHDFTFYTNDDTVYMSTIPSIPHFLTGRPVNPEVTVDEWYHEIWNSQETNSFYSLLRNAGYKAYAFTNAVATPELSVGSFENVVTQRVTDVSFHRLALCGNLFEVSLYRYLPVLLRHPYWILARSMGSNYTETCEPQERYENPYTNPGFSNALWEYGLSVDGSSKRYVFIHLEGMHEHTVDASGREKQNSSMAENGRGCFAIMQEYLDQLRALGVYDLSTIIITADHGDFFKDSQPICFVKRVGETRDEMAYSAAPVSENDYMATILAAAGVEEYAEFGRAYWDIPETEERLRSYWVRTSDSNYPAVRRRNSSIGYAADNVYYVYDYIGDRDDLTAQIAQGPTRIVPFVESLW